MIFRSGPLKKITSLIKRHMKMFYLSVVVDCPNTKLHNLYMYVKSSGCIRYLLLNNTVSFFFSFLFLSFLLLE